MRVTILHTIIVTALAKAFKPIPVHRNEPTAEFDFIREIVQYPSPHTKSQRAQDRVQPVKAFSKGRKKTWGRQ